MLPVTGTGSSTRTGRYWQQQVAGTGSNRSKNQQ